MKNLNLLLTVCNQQRQEKQGVTLLAAASGAPACCIPRNGDVSFISML